MESSYIWWSQGSKYVRLKNNRIQRTMAVPGGRAANHLWQGSNGGRQKAATTVASPWCNMGRGVGGGWTMVGCTTVARGTMVPCLNLLAVVEGQR